jgi:DNA polymerase-1
MCNYPVQGFATADLLPIALVRLHEMLKENNMQSVLCNTVHDSIVIDAHPTEIDDCIDIMKLAMLSVANGALERYGVRYDMPVEIEIKKGDNWLDTEDVGVFERTIDS